MMYEIQFENEISSGRKMFHANSEVEALRKFRESYEGYEIPSHWVVGIWSVD
jgi:hypothetical protein